MTRYRLPLHSLQLLPRLCLLGLLCLPSTVFAEQRWQLALSHTQTAERHGDFNATAINQQQALLQTWQQGARYQLQASVLSDQGRSKTLSEQLLINEAVLTGSTEQGDWLLGKKALNFSVSYGAKPLALLTVPLSQSLSTEPEQGYGLMMYSQFSDQAEYAVYCYSDQPLQRQNFLPKAPERLSQGCGVRAYQLQDAIEWQALGLFDQHQNLNLGASILTTIGEAWSLHAEALWRQKSPVWQLHTFAPPTTNTQPSTTALIGATYATLSGHQWVVEYWFEGRAWSQDDWQRFDQQVAQLTNLPQTPQSSLLQAQAQVFNAPALRQHNVMLHWRYNMGNWEPKLDLLLTDEAGWISTLGVQYQLRAWQASLQWRQMKGGSATVYGRLPVAQQILGQLHYHF